MKTDDLVSLLAAGVEPVNARRTGWRYRLAVSLGVLGALAITVGILHVNPGLSHEIFEPMFIVRAAYCGALGALGLAAMARLARPGIAVGAVPVGIAAVVVAMWILAALTLWTAPAPSRAHLLLGSTAAVCPFLITLVAIPSFVAFLWVLRGLAPVRQHSAGAAAGFAAGSLGALVYSLHCPELSAPFIGAWYLLGMLIPTVIGAVLAPKLVRW